MSDTLVKEFSALTTLATQEEVWFYNDIYIIQGTKTETRFDRRPLHHFTNSDSKEIVKYTELPTKYQAAAAQHSVKSTNTANCKIQMRKMPESFNPRLDLVFAHHIQEI